MKKIFFILLMMLEMVYPKNIIAQYNLVPNPSFEQYDTCPNNGGQLQYALHWGNPLYNSSPDYFNSCDTSVVHIAGVPDNGEGNEPAHTGSAYAGIITYILHPAFPLQNNYREYLQCQLIDSLLVGVDYCIRLFVSASDKSEYVSNNIGIYFSQNQIQDTCNLASCPLPYLPQFENPSSNNLNSRNGWTEISGTYTAGGGEKYIVIGNFRDSVSTIATNSGWSSFYWAEYYIDDVLITPCDSLSGIKENNQVVDDVRLFPSLAENSIDIETSEKLIQQVSIYSMLGQMIYNENLLNQKKIIIDISSLASDVYVVTVVTNKNKFNLKFIKN